MAGLLICAATSAIGGAFFFISTGVSLSCDYSGVGISLILGLALIPAALYLAWRAGGAA